MPTVMAERIRLIIDTEEVLRRAVRLRAAARGITHSDVINELIRKHLPKEVADAERAIAESEGHEGPGEGRGEGGTGGKRKPK